MSLDATMLGALKVYARNNQATIITPFIVAGAMAPTTAAGVAAQSLAEGMAGMAFAQLVRPGAPAHQHTNVPRGTAGAVAPSTRLPIPQYTYNSALT